MSRPATITAALLAALLAASCGGSDSSPSTTAPAATTTAAPTTGAPATTTTAPTTTAPQATEPVFGPEDIDGFRLQPTACGADRPAPPQPLQFDAPEDLALGTDPIRATLVTSCGEITLELDPARAPATVNSFVFLAAGGYFDGVAFHRVIPGFMAQGGDPSATGRGGPGYLLPDELPESGFLYTEGTVAMANAGPNTGGSQFFIMFDSPGTLPPAYAVFGRVVDGLDALYRFAEVDLGYTPRGEQSRPLETIYIETVRLDS